MLQLHCTHYKLRIEASYSEGHPSIFREHNSSPEVDLSVSPLKNFLKKNRRTLTLIGATCAEHWGGVKIAV